MLQDSPSSAAAQLASQTSSPAKQGQEALFERSQQVGRLLLQGMTALHAEVLPPGSGPKRAADHIGQTVPMASRILKALSASSPVGALHLFPGPAPLKRWVKAAGRKGAEAGTLKTALDAVDEFEALIATEGGDRAALDAQLVAWLPEARRTLELRRRQAVFRGLSELEGASCTLDLSTMILRPSADGQRVDLCCIQARTGIVALRPGTGIKFVTERMTAEGVERHPLSVEGAELEQVGQGVRLDAFCDGTPAAVEVAHYGDRYQYILRTPTFGPNASSDFVLAEVNPGEFELRGAGNGSGAPFFSQLIQLPSRYAVLDIILHRDLVSKLEPELCLYRNFGESQARPGDPLRDVDRIDPLDGVQHAHGALGDQRLAGFTRYGEMLEYVRERLDWDLDGAVMYRAQLDYPVPGTQQSLVLHGASF
ncbi:hypothetical protein Poly30_07230 [Planctomycetes bacterium Poly30]|uniref:Uncharacterized protein n=1 Tax=Saltatorellus ferox TaxID=2528018 RepID=A0A518EMB7_9BACT|nr:hypothetical protein Poly30_07230 [Planctomycetes bacterium Poly30]